MDDKRPYYEKWMEAQEIPIHRGYGLKDLPDLERAWWPHIGGPAAFVHLEGMEGFSSVQLCEISPGSGLRRQRHLYQASILILEGEGRLDIWPHEGGPRRSVKWKKNSLFAIPLNAAYELHNTGGSTAVYMNVNNAPLVLDAFFSDEFVFDNPMEFPDRFTSGDQDIARLTRHEAPEGVHLEGIFMDSVLDMVADEHGGKGERVKLTTLELAASTFASHVAEWPPNEYHQAHHHYGGAVLYILASDGYTLMWPLEAGLRPYESGNSDQVVRIDWEVGSLFCPPTKWFHQHFNTGETDARQLAFRGSSFHPSMTQRALNPRVGERTAAYTSVRKGGNLIDYDLEDPQIRRDYESAIAARRSGDSAGTPVPDA